MAHKRARQLVPLPQWWKHLRPYWRRVYWKRDRQEARAMLRRPQHPSAQGEAVSVR